MKLHRTEYIMEIADALVNTYGDTLMEGGTDVLMAKAVFRKIGKYLPWHSYIDPGDYDKWQRTRMLRTGLWEWVYDDNDKKTNQLTDGNKIWNVKK